jgi:hypothetical protein
MHIAKKGGLIAVGAALIVWSGPGAAQGALTMSDVKALISGNTVHAAALAGGQTFLAYHAPSGEIVVQRDDANEFSGYWSVRPDGTLCVSFSSEACGTVSKNADGTHTRNVGGVATYRWTRITPGKGF